MVAGGTAHRVFPVFPLPRFPSSDTGAELGAMAVHHIGRGCSFVANCGDAGDVAITTTATPVQRWR